MTDQLRQRVLELYTAPFTFQHGYIFDAAHKMVADDYGADCVLRIRGWGRVSYLPEPEKLQDMVGELIVEALNAYWEAHKEEPSSSTKKV